MRVCPPSLLCVISGDFSEDVLHTPHDQTGMAPSLGTYPSDDTVPSVRYVQPETPRKALLGEPPSIDPHVPNRNPFSPYRHHVVDAQSPIPCLVSGHNTHAAVVLYEHTAPTVLLSRQSTPVPSKSVTPRLNTSSWSAISLKFDAQDDDGGCSESPSPPTSSNCSTEQRPSAGENKLAVDGSARFLVEHNLASTGTGFVPLHLDVNGTVWLMTAITDGMPYAVKQVPLELSVADEVAALTLGSHPTTLPRCWAELFFARYHSVIDDARCHVVQTEYCHRGSLREAWSGLPDPRHLKSCIVQMLQAFAALHLEGFVHGAPMFYNVLVAGVNHFKLANFGSVTRLAASSAPRWAVPFWVHPPSGHPATRTPMAREGYMFLRSLTWVLGQLAPGVQGDAPRVPISVLTAYSGTDAYDVLCAVDEALRGTIPSEPVCLLQKAPLAPPPVQQFILQRAYDEERALVSHQVWALREELKRQHQSATPHPLPWETGPEKASGGWRSSCDAVIDHLRPSCPSLHPPSEPLSYVRPHECPVHRPGP